MTIIRDGHLYKLESLEGTNPQQLQFIEKQNVDGVFKTLYDGTTNEEVLAMLIDRNEFLYRKLPSKETAEALHHLREALMWFNERTKNRIAQNVENTPLPHKEKE